jgi:hypothetical protein
MNPEEILLFATKRSVAAFDRSSGRELWRTELPGGVSNGFVTLLADDRFVFAHGAGYLHALSLETGRILWSNELPGLGYQLGSLAFPNGSAAPDPAGVAKLHALASAQAHQSNP